MPAFQFRLNRVLEWYRTQFQLEENRLAVCLAALSKAQESIVRLQVESLRIEREVISGTAISARDLSALGLCRDRALKEQMSIVQAAQRRLRLVEKLRERRLAEHLYAEDQALESLAAEAYLSKWIAAKSARNVS